MKTAAGVVFIEGQVHNIGGPDMQAQTSFVGGLFDIAA
jgi:hypothetical protein